MTKNDLPERLLNGWVRLNGLLKDSAMTRGMTYNEAIIMRLALHQYRADGVGRVSVQRILAETNMMKSLVNRTVNALCAQGFLVKEKSGEDRRSLFVRPVPEKLPDFLCVHRQSLKSANEIIGIIGEDDAEAFIRCCEKLSAAHLSFQAKPEGK